MTCRAILASSGQTNPFKKYTDKEVLLLQGDIVDARNHDHAGTRETIDAFIDMH